MKCICCKERLHCNTSLDKKILSEQEPLVPDKKPVKYRRYVCPKCGSTYTTQEICDSRKLSKKGREIYQARKAGK